jgi:serine/threonine protein kinase
VLSSNFVAKGSKAEKQFVAEIDILTSITHTNICSLYASSTNGDHKCAVLELMDISLEHRLENSEFPPLSWKQRVYIALCMFRGVVALHSMRPVQIHRDIKTSNLLLNGFTTSTLHTSCIAKIADFGTAREFDPRAPVSSARPQLQTFSFGITHANLTENVVGTYPYMANEYLEEGRVSEKTDAFAMGIVLIELLTGMDSMDARGLAETEGQENIAAATFDLARRMHVGTTVAEDGAIQAAKVLGEIAAFCIAALQQRKAPAQLLPRVEEAYRSFNAGL